MMAVANIKSNAYQPVGTCLFGQLMVERQLEQHYKLINRAKPTVDNKTPKSWQNLLKSRKSAGSSAKSSRPSSRLSQLSSNMTSTSMSEDQQILRNALKLPRSRHVANDPLNGLKTSDKLALYIDIISDNAQQSSRAVSRNSRRDATDGNKKKVSCGKSKLRDLRSYNKPIKCKVPRQETCMSSKQIEWLNDQASKAVARQHMAMPQQSTSESEVCDEDDQEEMLYLDFVAQVTDDILDRGIFSNRVLKSVMKSHIDKNSGHLNVSKMNLLIDKLRQDLGIPQQDSQDEIVAGFGTMLSTTASQPPTILDMFCDDVEKSMQNLCLTSDGHDNQNCKSSSNSENTSQMSASTFESESAEDL